MKIMRKSYYGISLTLKTVWSSISSISSIFFSAIFKASLGPNVWRSFGISVVHSWILFLMSSFSCSSFPEREQTEHLKNG